MITKDDKVEKTELDSIVAPSIADATSLTLGARMLEAVQAMCENPGIDDFPSTGWLPDPFFENLEEFYRWYDAYIAYNLKASELEVQCKRGCDRCCHQLVWGLYNFEIINLYRQLRSHQDFKEIHNQFIDASMEIETTVQELDPAGTTVVPSDHPALEIAHPRHSAAAKPCPLLVDGVCRVYEHRPVSCRMYHSQTDPIYCTTTRGKTFHLEPPKKVDKLLWHLSKRLPIEYPGFMAQGLVTFGFDRRFLPWQPPADMDAKTGNEDEEAAGWAEQDGLLK